MSNAQPQYESPQHSFDGHAAPRSSSPKMASPYLVPSSPQTSAESDLTIAVIGPNPDRRSAAATAFSAHPSHSVRQFSTFSSSGTNDLVRMVDEQYQVALIDLDGDSDFALDLVKRICAMGRTTVMVFSAAANPDLLVRCMRAGAREFLEAPFSETEVSEALTRVAKHQPAPVSVPKKSGKLLVFLGAKGGVGVTSLACNYAVAMAQQAGQKALLIDLDLPLGDAALQLGIMPQYSTADALGAAERLDGEFLAKLVVEHSSGLSVLAAPGKFPNAEAGTDASIEAIGRLLKVARKSFDHVIVDLGSRTNPGGQALYDEATVVYLVTQAGIPELRNANRLISQVFSNMASEDSGLGSPRLEVVLNCFEKSLGITEEHIAKALTRPVQWKVPNEKELMRKMQVNATPLALGDLPVAKAIRQMAKAVSPQTGDESSAESKAKGKKKGFSFFS